MTLPDDPAARKRQRENERDGIRYATEPQYAERKRAQAKRWGRENTERNRARAAQWAKAHPEIVAERSRKYYLAKAVAMRNAFYKTKYGITTNDYDLMLVEQRGKCAICRNESKRHRLCVDHCHDTGKIRGLLCHTCNRAIGLMRDCGDTLQAAAAYVRHHKRQVQA